MHLEVSVFFFDFFNNFNTIGTIRCINSACRRQFSLKVGTFFGGSNLPIWKQLSILACWINGVSINSTSKSLGVSINSISKHFATYRQIIVDYVAVHPITFDRYVGEYEVYKFFVKNVSDGWHRCCWVAGIVERSTGR